MRSSSHSAIESYIKICGIALCAAVFALVALRVSGLAGGVIFNTVFSACALSLSIEFLLLLLYEKKGKERGISLESKALSEAEKRISSLKEQLALAQEKSKQSTERLKTLSQEIELLAAMREVSLIATQEVDFRGVLENVLKVLEEVIGAQEIILFLKDETSSEICAKAARIDGKSHFDDSQSLKVCSNLRAISSVEHGTLIRVAERGTISITAPVSVDNYALGAIEVKIPAKGAGDAEISQKEDTLRHLVNHIALAIKTPTLYGRAVLDSLTGLFTKRHLQTEISALFAAAQRGKNFSVIMFDIDHFKKINDTYGHLTGDIVLREVAAIVKREIRKYDSAFRYGGEEICVLLPDSRIQTAFSVAQRIRLSVQNHSFTGEKGESIRVTISGGVAMYKKDAETPESIISEADAALYQAKQRGRNQIRQSSRNLQRQREESHQERGVKL